MFKTMRWLALSLFLPVSTYSSPLLLLGPFFTWVPNVTGMMLKVFNPQEFIGKKAKELAIERFKKQLKQKVTKKVLTTAGTVGAGIVVDKVMGNGSSPAVSNTQQLSPSPTIQLPPTVQPIQIPVPQAIGPSEPESGSKSLIESMMSLVKTLVLSNEVQRREEQACQAKECEPLLKEMGASQKDLDAIRKPGDLRGKMQEAVQRGAERLQKDAPEPTQPQSDNVQPSQAEVVKPIVQVPPKSETPAHNHRIVLVEHDHSFGRGPGPAAPRGNIGKKGKENQPPSADQVKYEQWWEGVKNRDARGESRDVLESECQFVEGHIRTYGTFPPENHIESFAPHAMVFLNQDIQSQSQTIPLNSKPSDSTAMIPQSRPLETKPLSKSDSVVVSLPKKQPANGIGIYTNVQSDDVTKMQEQSTVPLNADTYGMLVGQQRRHEQLMASLSSKAQKAEEEKNQRVAQAYREMVAGAALCAQYRDAIGEGIVETAQEVGHMVAHPVQTIEGLGHLLYKMAECIAKSDIDFDDSRQVEQLMHDNKVHEQMIAELAEKAKNMSGSEWAKLITKQAAGHVMTGGVAKLAGGTMGVVSSNMSKMTSALKTAGKVEQAFDLQRRFDTATKHLKKIVDPLEEALFGSKPRSQHVIIGGPHAPTTTLKEAEHLGGAGKVGAKANPGKVYEPHVAEGSFRNSGATDKLKTIESSVEKVQESVKGVEKLKGGATGLAEETLGQLSQQAIDEGIKWATKENKLIHIFDKKAHNLDQLVEKLGGQEATISAVLNSAKKSLPINGKFWDLPVKVEDVVVHVRGFVVDGVPKLGTMFIKQG